jgi:uncharacterized protein with NRDE domain
MVGANREESRRRPSTPPLDFLSGTLRCFLAGADRGPDGSFPEVGTWLGVNETGLIVAVTNRRDGELGWAEQVRSRGLLAVALLGYDDPKKAAQFAQDELAGGGFGGCNYMIANGETAVVVQAPGARRISAKDLPPGVHAMTNLDLDDFDDARIRFVAEHLEPDRFATSAKQICRDERIVIDGVDRGTVSSSLVLVGSAIRFYHVIGDPRMGESELFTPFSR